MLTALDLSDDQLRSPLGRASPVLKLAIALAWLLGLALTTDPRPPLVLAVVAILAAVGAGAVPPARLLRAAWPLVLAALAVGATNALFSSSNADLATPAVLVFGPFRVTGPALATGAGLAARVLAIVAVGAAFAQTTDPTHLVDALVRQARLPGRFAYGALAAYQAMPRLAEDLAAIRAARRSRGLRTTWHPRVLLTLLVRAIRHADQLSMAMDARGFGRGPRTEFREVRWAPADAVLGLAAASILVGALVLFG